MANGACNQTKTTPPESGEVICLLWYSAGGMPSVEPAEDGMVC